MEYEVLVQLKGEVLDPEARAIKEALKNQGVAGVEDIHVAKRYVVRLGQECKDPEKTIHDIATHYFANPVAQTFKINRV